MCSTSISGKKPFPDAKVKEGLKVRQAGRRSDISAWEIKVCQGGEQQQQVNYSQPPPLLFMLFSSSEVSTVVCRQIPALPHLLMPRRPKRFRPSSLFLLLPPSLCLTLSQRTKGGGRGRGRNRRTQTRRRRRTKKSHPDRGGRVARLTRNGKPSYYFAIPWNMIKTSLLFGTR